MILRINKLKNSYTKQEVASTHNKYRVCIIVILTFFLWVAHRYGIADDIIKDITGGAVKIKDGQSFWSLMLDIGKWIASASALVFSGIMIWQKLIKKDANKK